MTIDDKQYPIIYVDDEPDNLDTFRFNFRKRFTLLTAQSADIALETLKKEPVAVAITDQRMPQKTGLEFLKEAKAIRPDIIGIIITAYTDVNVLIDAVNSGYVYRYISKPWDSKELILTIHQAIERYVLLQENRRLLQKLQDLNAYLRYEMDSQYNFGEIIAKSKALQDVLEVVKQVAPTGSTVLLRGESGTGKELFARAIHLMSPRRSESFVRVNCAALAPGVLESELFGHEKGAFTGAIYKKVGRFELADKGTIFLDEIGDIQPEIQMKLLRVLQEREFERVGGTESIKVDVRVISATHKNLEELLRSGQFRDDLYYRLNVFPIFIPPLRDRVDDIEEIARHCIAKFSKASGKIVKGIHEEAMIRLMDYKWPGNVRELENALERALILAKGEWIEAGDLAFNPVFEVLDSDRGGPAGRPEGLNDALEDMERERLQGAMEKYQGRKSDVARELGINRSTLYYRLKKYGLE